MITNLKYYYYYHILIQFYFHSSPSFELFSGFSVHWSTMCMYYIIDTLIIIDTSVLR